ncbi:MAG: uroporphyrinogen decarboxylase family protein [Acidobacteriota bacterium]|nr:uroporphyrinogen decarboxylase family protein [Acidobacteriota bacterium]
MMTTRERFNRVMHWRTADRVPNMEFGYWKKTIEVWREQGLPGHLKTNADVERYLGLEGISTLPEIPVKNGLYPEFEEKTLEVRDGRRIIRRRDGSICEAAESDSSIPRFIKFAVETRKDWEKFKEERLDVRWPGRIGDIPSTLAAARASGMPVLMHCGSLYGWIRDFMGLENLSIALITDRTWMEEVMEHLAGMTLFLIEKTLDGVEVDAAWWWEDMCYNHGPLVSPKLFEEMMVPRYRRITEALGRRGIDVNVLDCDGRIYDLVPGWLRGGINGMFPIEAAHTDPLRLRRDHGDEVLLIGGVNKLALIAGREAIDRELERLHPLVERGGYIPTVDHRVPPDVTFENYLYYLEKKKDIL